MILTHHDNIKTIFPFHCFNAKYSMRLRLYVIFYINFVCRWSVFQNIAESSSFEALFDLMCEV